MEYRYITPNDSGGISIIQIIGSDEDGAKLTKMLFELSRTTDKETHFNKEIHTREAIAAGLEGHSPLELLAEIEETDVPTDDSFRDAWEWED